MLALCFSSNNFSDDLEVVEDLDDLDELRDFELLLDFQDLEDMDNFGLLFTGFDGICLSKGFLRSVSYRVSNSFHLSRKFSTVLVISIT